ncbi:hypothetical protein [Occultella gossypii]|uniref:2TM domain-containing protein n=1 Tax=Occultella gossypii TaxID=2800820 RepID=A0ABS7SAC9_9MICO|nr:hypothetical protein [Occultella gossypii]MBZ2197309.1 hypothetical protein [Occultella gossypii]
MNVRPVGATPVSNGTLARYLAGLAVGLLVVHGWTALVAEHHISVVSALLLAAVAAYVVVFLARNRAGINQRAYGLYFVHVATYLLINGSFWLYAGLLELTGNGAALNHGWAGPLYAMSICWGIGLLVHTLGALFARGYESVEV